MDSGEKKIEGERRTVIQVPLCGLSRETSFTVGRKKKKKGWSAGGRRGRILSPRPGNLSTRRRSRCSEKKKSFNHLEDAGTRSGETKPRRKGSKEVSAWMPYRLTFLRVPSNNRCKRRVVWGIEMFGSGRKREPLFHRPMMARDIGTQLRSLKRKKFLSKGKKLNQHWRGESI